MTLVLRPRAVNAIVEQTIPSKLYISSFISTSALLASTRLCRTVVIRRAARTLANSLVNLVSGDTLSQYTA